jgi:hypothetical protein
MEVAKLMAQPRSPLIDEMQKVGEDLAKHWVSHGNLGISLEQFERERDMVLHGEIHPDTFIFEDQRRKFSPERLEEVDKYRHTLGIDKRKGSEEELVEAYQAGGMREVWYKLGRADPILDPPTYIYNDFNFSGYPVRALFFFFGSLL